MPQIRLNQQGQTLIILIILVLVVLALYSFVPGKQIAISQSNYQNNGCQEYTGPEVLLHTKKEGDAKLVLTGVLINKGRTVERGNQILDANNNGEIFATDNDNFVRDGITYAIYYPSGHSKVNNTKARPKHLGLIFAIQHNPDQTRATVTIERGQKGLKGEKLSSGTYYLTDVYQKTKQPIPPIPRDLIETCQKNSVSALSNSSADTNDFSIVFPSQNLALPPNNEQLQLEYFLIDEQPIAGAGFWRLHCKPAVYLYPKTKTLVNVKVFPKGELTYTDPKYPNATGWMAHAYPNGDIEVNNIFYPYLYYEAKIQDQLIQVPEEGFAVKSEDLSKLFDQLLPKLGLSQKESNEFKDYWVKSLPNSPYYFVGVLPQEHIDFLEPLEINPKPDTNIRVHLYFKLLDKPIEVKSPIIETPKRNGFTMVEWGGMIKVNKDSDFTCLQ